MEKKYTFFDRDDWYINKEPIITSHVLGHLNKFRELLRKSANEGQENLSFVGDNVNFLMPLVFTNQGAEKYDWTTQAVVDLMEPGQIWFEEMLESYLEIKKKSMPKILQEG